MGQPLGDIIVTLWVIGLAIGLYLLPTIVAFNRNPPNRWSVVVVNVLLGWTFVGWAVALAMAVRDRPRPAPG